MAKPRGRPPADGNWITWTDPMVGSLLRLRFEQFAERLAAARGTKSLKQAWAELAAQLSRQYGGDAISVQQCRNKSVWLTWRRSSLTGAVFLACNTVLCAAPTATAQLKALKSKWLAYHAGGLHSEPACLELMDVYWASERDQATASTLGRRPRLSTEMSTAGTPIKRQRADAPASSPSAPAPESSTPSSVASFTSIPTPIAPTPATSTTDSPVTTTATATATATATTTATLPVLGNPAQLLDRDMQTIPQGFTDIGSAAVDTIRPTGSTSSTGGDLVGLANLLDRRLAQVVERQDRQLRQAEVQTQLLLRLVTSLERLHGLPGPLD